MGGLTSFRLADVPLEVRLKAAARAARSSSDAIPEAKRAADRLFLRLLAPPTLDFAAYERVARQPSGRVYWIPTAAYERVMKR